MFVTACKELISQPTNPYYYHTNYTNLFILGATNMIIHNASATNPSNILPSEITPPTVFEQRRAFIAQAGMGLLLGSAAIFSAKSQAANIAGGATTGDARLIGRANAPATEKGAAKELVTKIGSRQK